MQALYIMANNSENHKLFVNCTNLMIFLWSTSALTNYSLDNLAKELEVNYLCTLFKKSPSFVTMNSNAEICFHLIFLSRGCFLLRFLKSWFSLRYEIKKTALMKPLLLFSFSLLLQDLSLSLFFLLNT